MGELIYVEECMRRSRRIAKCLRKTFEVIACRPDVGNVSYDFHDVRDRSSVPREKSLDLVKRVAALPENVSRVQDGANRSVFVFGTDSGQKNHCARPRDGDDFRESCLSPLAVVVILLFKI